MTVLFRPQIEAVFLEGMGVAAREADVQLLRQLGSTDEVVAHYIWDHWMGEPETPSEADVRAIVLEIAGRVGDAGLPLPTHRLDDGWSASDKGRGVCPYSGTGDMAQGCPRGCEGAREHYSNDGHPECGDLSDERPAQ